MLHFLDAPHHNGRALMNIRGLDLQNRLPGRSNCPAARLFNQLMTGADFPEFLTLVAYEHLE